MRLFHSGARARCFYLSLTLHPQLWIISTTTQARPPKCPHPYELGRHDPFASPARRRALARGAGSVRRARPHGSVNVCAFAFSQLSVKILESISSSQNCVPKHNTA